MKYRKRPVVVDAWLFINGTRTKQEWLELVPGANIGTRVLDREKDPEAKESKDFIWFIIDTLEGPMHVSEGDFVVRGTRGEFYPCKPDPFEDSHEPLVDADTDQCISVLTVQGVHDEHSDIQGPRR